MNVLGILAMVGSFLDNPLVKRLLVNLSKSIDTPVVYGTQVDDWVIRVLYGAEEKKRSPEFPNAAAEDVKLGLKEVQDKYDAMSDEEKSEAKRLRTLSPPWLGSDHNNPTTTGTPD